MRTTTADTTLTTEDRADAQVFTGPSHDEIAARAYELYMERAADEGTATEDWLRAEHELLEEQLRTLAPTSSARRLVRHTTAHDLASK